MPLFTNSTKAFRNRSAEVAPKLKSLIKKISSGNNFVSSVGTLITSRIIFTSRFSFSPARAIASVTAVPTLPLIKLVASLIVKPLTSVPATFIILSPAFKPARLAGEPSRGEITVSAPSRAPISIPMPPNSPWISSLKTLLSSGGMKSE